MPEDAAPEYQSLSGLAGLRAFLFAKLFSVARLWF